jgi:elongation factor P
MLGITALKNGTKIELDGEPFVVTDYQHSKMGRGGAVVRTKLRNLKTGGVQEKTFNAGVKVGLAIVERKDMQYLYRDGESLTFMDMSSYEQIPVPAEIVGDGASWLSEGATAQVAMHQGIPIGVELPASVTLAITKTQPAVKGDTKTNAMKPAVLETGAEIQVPMFVEEGERVKVDTRSGAYMERVK